MKTALILNFTGNGYHFGCYGTAREIYHRLEQKGYLVNYLSVQATHHANSIPRKASDFSSSEFISNYVKANYAIYTSIMEADVVVVNGEGTLHRLRPVAIHLLFMAHLAKVIANKPTYLINHSCFPSLEDGTGKAGGLYAKALRGLDAIVPREHCSLDFYHEHGIKADQGFDSLPLYIERVGLTTLRERGVDDHTILICGGINYDPAAIKVLSFALNKMDKRFKFKFLLGGKQDLARDEIPIFQSYRKAGLIMELVEAKTFEQWCSTIASSAGLLSGRFHYTIAALALGTPCLSLPSNTPKIEAIHSLLGHSGCMTWKEAVAEDGVSVRLEKLLAGEFNFSGEMRERALTLGEVNYNQIPN